MDEHVVEYSNFQELMYLSGEIPGCFELDQFSTLLWSSVFQNQTRTVERKTSALHLRFSIKILIPSARFFRFVLRLQKIPLSAQAGSSIENIFYDFEELGKAEDLIY